MRAANNATTWALSVFDSDLSAGQKLICLYLRTYMNDYRDCAWPAVGTIAAKCNLSVRSVQTYLKAIQEAGYLMANGHGPKGTIRYEICTPAEIAPHANPAPPPPQNLRGAPANPAPELNKELNNLIKQISGWNEWVEYRKEIKKKMTPATVKKQTAFLSSRPPAEQQAIIDQSIQNGWTGLFELKGQSNGSKANGKSNPQGGRTISISALADQGYDFT